MDKQRSIVLDDIAKNVVDQIIFSFGETNVERAYLSSKIQEYITIKERTI